jgi:acetyl-CoA carboxylase biotin carboxyl carrier protein
MSIGRYGDAMGSHVEVVAELAANVWQVAVEVGQRVEEGDVLVILESMKMEIPVEAPSSGTVTVLNVAPESQVQDGDVIAVITTD